MTRLLTTAEVAAHLNVAHGWVREHAGELGAIRLGSTSRGELRFDPAEVNAAKDRRRLERPAVRREPRRPGPVRGALAARIPASAKEW